MSTESSLNAAQAPLLRQTSSGGSDAQPQPESHLPEDTDSNTVRHSSDNDIHKPSTSRGPAGSRDPSLVPEPADGGESAFPPTPDEDEAPKFKTWFRVIHVSPYISPVNFAGYLLATLFTICTLTLVNTMQTFYLDNVIGIRDDVGQATGNLGFWDQIVSVPMAAVWGAVSDWTGRRVLYALGFWIV